MLEKIKAFIFAIFSYKYWLQIYQYNKEWDDHLNFLLKTEKFTNITHYYANLGNIKVWIENHPYASFEYEFNGNNPFINSQLRPKRYTKYKAYKKLKDDYYSGRPEQLFPEKEKP